MLIRIQGRLRHRMCVYISVPLDLRLIEPMGKVRDSSRKGDLKDLAYTVAGADQLVVPSGVLEHFSTSRKERREVWLVYLADVAQRHQL